MDLFQQFSTDNKKQADGVWYDLPGSDTRLLIASTGSAKYQKVLAKAAPSIEQARKSENDEKARDILVDMMAKHILVGWEGVTFKGQDLPFSVDAARELLSMPEFLDLVLDFASSNENYRHDAVQELGNDSPSA